MFEFLGLFFEIIYTTLLELVYSFFVAPLKTLYYIAMEYIIAIGSRSLCFCGSDCINLSYLQSNIFYNKRR